MPPLWAGSSGKIHTEKLKTGGDKINQEILDITLQHLINTYGKAGIDMFLESKNSLFDFHGLAWELGKNNFKYFCQVFLHDFLFDYSGDNVPLSETHYSIWEELEYTILNKNNTRNCYIFPRSFGKSSTITIPVAIWCALYCFHPFIVIDSATENQAQNFIKTIKIWLENNELIKSAFGEIINKKELIYNASNIELDVSPQRVLIKAVSSTQSVRGINYGAFRVGLLILDDAQDEKQITTDKARADLISNFNTGIMKTLQNQSNHVIALGTIQQKGDLYDNFLTSPVWQTRIEKCVQIDDIDRYFNSNEHWQKVREIIMDKVNNNNAIFDAESYYLEHKEEMDFPLIWNNYKCFDLALEYFEDAVAFKKERQCSIKNLGQRRITAFSAIPEKDIESVNFTKTILSVDPSATTNRKSDYYAFCVLGEADNHIRYARKCIIDKIEFDEYIDMVLELLERYTDINILSIEKNVYMGADVLKIRERINDSPTLRGRTINIINKSRSKNKDARINTIIPDINMGRIIFNENDVAANEQIKEFAGTAFTVHDDMIDALADAVENIAETQTAEVPKLIVLNWDKFGL